MSSELTRQGPGRSNGLGGIEQRTTKFWAVGADKIIEELPDGRFTVVDCFRLDMQGLLRLHSVLDHVLMDLTMGQVTDNERRPPF
jgi:hypothetical protein